MGDIVIPNTFVSNTLIESADVNENFQAVADGALNKAGDTATGKIIFQDDVDVGGDLDVTGTLTAGTISGSVSVDASTLTGTTIASNVVTSSLITVGTVTSGTWSAAFGAVSGANLTGLNASNLGSGTVPLTRLSGITTSQMASANVSQFSNDAGYLTSASVTGVPTGCITMWGKDTPPTDWLLCNGAAYSTTTYAALYAVIGTTYGGGGGTFNVPNFTQRFPIGKSGGSTPGATLGEAGGAANHTHTAPSHTHSIATGGTTTTTGTHAHTPSGSTGTESAHTHTLSSHVHSISVDTSYETVVHAHSFSSTSDPGGHTHTQSGIGVTTGSDDTCAANSMTSEGAHTHSGTTGNPDQSTSHRHSVSGQNTGGGSEGSGAGSAHSHTASSIVISGDGGHSHTTALTATTTGTDGAYATSGNNPPYLTVHFIIKT